MADDDNCNDESLESDSSTCDFGGDETQLFDSQFCESPISTFGDRCDDDTQQFPILQDTTIRFDELETQVMDPDCETQLVNFGGETQLVEFDAEIEVMMENETQLFSGYDTEEVVSDHEGTDKTEIVDDSGGEECVDSKNLQQCKEDVKDHSSETDCGRSEVPNSGIGFKTFTSIRAASMRAAGLAALHKASENRHGRDTETVKQSTVGHETGCIFGRSAARKLFDEGTLAETKELNDKFDLGEGANSPILDTELAGLSYIDSQEPGDASQANALDFVDNFLKVNIECDDDCGVKKSTGGKSKPELSAKGVRAFAESADLIDAGDKGQIFCWDDKLEDEGGGEFFEKKKEVLFASGSRKPKSSVPSRSVRKLESKLVSGKNKENDKSNKNLGTVIKGLTSPKNLLEELDKQSADIPGGMDIQETIQENFQEATELRFDTQMAAEAMEELCFGLQETGHDSTKANAQCNHMQKGSHKSQPTTRSKSKKGKHAKSGAKKSEYLDDVSFNMATRIGKTSLKRREFDSVDQMLVKKQCIQNITPVARRTRLSIKDNGPNNDLNIPTGFYPKGRRTSQRSSTKKEPSTRSISRLTKSKAATLTKQENGSVSKRSEQSIAVCTTPSSRRTPVKESSPVCMGDEYLKQSCRRSSLIQEVNSLFPTDSLFKSPSRETRLRRDVSLIRVLFSRHLDGDIIKQQKKILSRLGASESTSMSDATHFIADDFTRTRNMLEAIALGKPIVTHLWLESCGQACCHIDEKNFILRDAKKEKEFSFSLPSSLARARQIPLLKGQRVLITPNTKPGKEILSSLVNAVHGVAVERTSRSLLNDGTIPEELLILSCEEDYAACLPFLEKGTAIYSSELLLNGIVTQRLEYERHRLFLDHVKRTRSTIWLKKDDNQYKPVGKGK